MLLQPLPKSDLTARTAARIADAWGCVEAAAGWAEPDCAGCQFIVDTLVASARWEQAHLPQLVVVA